MGPWSHRLLGLRDLRLDYAPERVAAQPLERPRTDDQRAALALRRQCAEIESRLRTGTTHEAVDGIVDRERQRNVPDREHAGGPLVRQVLHYQLTLARGARVGGNRSGVARPIRDQRQPERQRRGGTQVFKVLQRTRCDPAFEVLVAVDVEYHELVAL